MSLHLYNSLTRRVEPFVPIDPARPTMYVCGPTVYNYVHIGNARGPVVFGVLADLLRRRYGGLVYARNITDVDDKINAAAAEQRVPISAITDRYAAAYREDMAALGVRAPDLEPAATAHIDQIIAMIERLIANGHAYAAEGHALFAIGSFDRYGKLSRRDPEEMLAGARVEVAPYKRDAGDFVLWKPSTGDLPGWDSPWGRGRPGWHIECSAMAAAHLGETIDIHAGGVDLQFPHHENEIAQSECAHGGKIFARHWLHNGMLNFGGAKMSKSLGNIERVHDLVREHPPEALRYALLSAHYRQPLDWSDSLIAQSVQTLNKLYRTLSEVNEVVAEPLIPEAVEVALDDDLSTPKAIEALQAIARKLRNHPATAQLAEIRAIRYTLDSQKKLNVSLNHAIAGGLLEGLRAKGGHVSNIFETENWLATILDSPEEKGRIEFHMKAELDLAEEKAADQVRPLKADLLGAGLALGLLQQDPAAWFARGADGSDDARIQALIDERNAAKKNRDFARSDAIRDQLAGEGILLEDTPQGVRWVRKRA